MVVQGTCSIPIPTLAAGWSGGGEFLGVETHILGQPSLCTRDAAVVAWDHRHPNPSGAGAAPGMGLSSLPEREEQFAACRGGNLAEAAPLCLLIQKLGLLSWNDFPPPPANGSCQFSRSTTRFALQPGEQDKVQLCFALYQALEVLPRTDSRQASMRVVTAGQGLAKGTGESLQNEQLM